MIDTFKDYAMAIETVAIYPHAGTGSTDALVYTTLGLVGEAGEFADKVKKILRDGQGVITHDQHVALAKELGDVLWYVSRTATELGLPLALVAEDNVTKLLDRKDRGVLGGSGDNR